MRNAMLVEDNLVVTTDNSGGIGEKAQDVVQAPDALTAHYSARVALLEQWAANSRPIAVLIHNFSGAASWAPYVAGVRQLLEESKLQDLPISGSTETNVELLQSAVSITMIGTCRTLPEEVNGKWFTYGAPLVGQEVIDNPKEVASIQKINEALETKLVHKIWPVGSKGILHEIRHLLNDEDIDIESQLNLTKTGGPSTVVLVYLSKDRIEEAQKFFGETLRNLKCK